MSAPEESGARPEAGGHERGPLEESAPRPRHAANRQAIRRAIFLVLAIGAISLAVRAIIGERGLLEAHRSRQELDGLTTEVEELRRKNAEIETEIQALRQDPATIEKLARERLDMVKPGEITFLFPYDPKAGKAGKAAGDRPKSEGTAPAK